MHVRLYTGFLYSVDAHSVNDWNMTNAQSLDDGVPLIPGEDQSGNVSMETLIFSEPRTS